MVTGGHCHQHGVRLTMRTSQLKAQHMATERLSDRMRRAESGQSLAGLVRALADNPGRVMDAVPAEVRAATLASQAEGRACVQGAYQDAVTIPMGMMLRDLSVATSSSLLGSARIDPQQSMRPFSMTVDAGLRVVEVPNGTGAPGVPNVSTPPTAGWAATESAEVPESDAVFGIVHPETRRMGFSFYVSWQLLKLGGELFDILIKSEVASGIGRGFDVAVLQGTGASGQPTGLATLSGVNTAAGASLAHAGLLEMRKEALAGGAREDRLRWIAAPAVQETLSARERSTNSGRYLWDDGAVLGRPAHATDTAPAAALFCGDFSLATMYLFGGLDLVIDRRFLASGGKVRFVASVYADLVVNRPAAFSRATSIT